MVDLMLEMVDEGITLAPNLPSHHDHKLQRVNSTGTTSAVTHKVQQQSYHIGLIDEKSHYSSAPHLLIHLYPSPNHASLDFLRPDS